MLLNIIYDLRVTSPYSVEPYVRFQSIRARMLFNRMYGSIEYGPVYGKRHKRVYIIKMYTTIQLYMALHKDP